jgi:hypothetical protein
MRPRAGVPLCISGIGCLGQTGSFGVTCPLPEATGVFSSYISSSVIVAAILIFIVRECSARNSSCRDQMKLRMDRTLRFWVDVAYDEIKSDHHNVTKQQLLAQILRQYEERGHAMRCLDKQGKIAWKASPLFLTKLADAERDAKDDLKDWP